MKSTVRTIILVAASVFAAVSCQKEAAVSETQNSVKAGETIQVNINASLGDLVAADGTKATAESVVRLKWAEGDVVQAYCGTDKISTEGLIVTPSDNGMFASLTGTIDPAPEANEIITFVYSSGCTADGLTFDFSSQDAEIPFVAYATLVYDGTATLTNKMVEFKFATSVMKIAATDLGHGKITNVDLSGINTKVTLTPVQSGTPNPTIAGSANSTNISTENFTASLDFTRAIVTVGLVPDNNATARKISFTKEGIDTIKEISIASDEIKESTSYYTPCAFEGADIEFVYIGGRKWATRNLGATNVNDYGKLYSWGNLTGQSGSSFNPAFDGTNYNSTDGKSIDPTNNKFWDKTKHDAAYNELGGSWRMPNKDDFIALDKACNGSGDNSQSLSAIVATDIDNGKVKKGKYRLAANQEVLKDIEGLKNITEAGLLYSDGSKYLFFPAAGYGDDTSLMFAGTRGRYWSSTWISSGQALGLAFTSSGINPQFNYNRYYGFSVRPVSD